MTLDTARLRTMEQVEAFMQGTAEVGFSPPLDSERDAWIGRTLSPFSYQGCDRRQRGLLHNVGTQYFHDTINRLFSFNGKPKSPLQPSSLRKQ